MSIEAQKDQFDQWCDKWEKAMSDGTFENAPQQRTTPCQTADVSYFGPTDTHPTSDLRDADVQYWNDVYAASRHSGDAPDPIVLHEAKEAAKQAADAAKAMSQSPNPIRAGSVGMDQAMEPGPLGVTFTPDQIQELAEMKLKLHGLQDKIAALEGEGKGDKKVESTISSLRSKIDELSNALGRAFPNAVLPQGD